MGASLSEIEHVYRRDFERFLRVALRAFAVDADAASAVAAVS